MMILNISTSLLSTFLRWHTNYYKLSNNLGLPIKVLENTNYYHVHWAGSLMPPLKPTNAYNVQQVNYFLV